MDLYTTGDELEKHFKFHILKVFNYPLDREVDEGVMMVIHMGILVNSTTEWFSPSIVRIPIGVLKWLTNLPEASKDHTQEVSQPNEPAKRQG